MIKDLGAPYLPGTHAIRTSPTPHLRPSLALTRFDCLNCTGKRADTWLKVKKDYVDGLADSIGM